MKLRMTGMAAILITFQLNSFSRGEAFSLDMPATQAATTQTAPTSAPATSQPGGQSEFDKFFAPVRSYEPMYFIGGSGDSAAKFQLSFKYQLLTDDNNPNAWWNGLYFGYTQKALWDIAESSSPFEDINYRPELLYYWPTKYPLVGPLKLQDVLTGVAHESNGRAGADSRSLYEAYIEPTFRLARDNNGASLDIAPRARVYLGTLNDNPDLDQFRGYLSVEARLNFGNNFVLPDTMLTAKVDIGDSAEHLGTEINLLIPLHKAKSLGFGSTHLSFNPFLHIQYFTGYGETLLNYNRRGDGFRVGVAIVP